MNLPASPILELIPEILKSQLKDYQAYLVGGFIRDYFLAQTFQASNPKLHNSPDFDFVILDKVDLHQISRSIADLSDSSFVVLDAENQIYRIVNKDWQADIAAPKKANHPKLLSIDSDLEARDFTINAIALDLKSQCIIDPLDGLKDLTNRLVKCPSEQNLIDDPLRMLRAYRFAAHLGEYGPSTIDTQTTDWITKHKDLITKVASERISSEIWNLLSSSVSYKYLWLCLESGLWEVIFPEFQELRQVPANDFHHLPLIEHTFELIKQLEDTVQKLLSKECQDNIQNTNLSKIPTNAIIKMGCLLHDIAKPSTWKIINNKHTFHGHDLQGAQITENIGKRMMWPKAVTRSISRLVEFHLRPFHIAPVGQEATEKAERRFFRKLEQDFYPLIALAWADLLSTRGPMISQENINLSQIRLTKLCSQYEIFIQQETSEAPLLQGDLLKQAIDQSGLPQTKIIKEKLAELRELQISKAINSPKEAFEWFTETGKGN